ncbi:MAG: methyltransferase domain-containing protein [Nitriliruptorales bacterium]|nr:methyltransferase domain-containing protein [Nitriliruptorales bacterium]
MLLNRVEELAMNNPLRAAVQHHGEARILRRLGGGLPGARVLEIGCGRGVGIEVILDRFGAAWVDGFDLDPQMVARARGRLARRGDRVRVWTSDATAIDAPDAAYDAVFDFAILHHIPHWWDAVGEVHRVLRGGGRLYVEEPLRAFITNPFWAWLLEHPQNDRFDADDLRTALVDAGFRVDAQRRLGQTFTWIIATRV